MSKGRLSSLIWRNKKITYLSDIYVQMNLMWNILTLQNKTHKTIKPTFFFHDHFFQYHSDEKNVFRLLQLTSLSLCYICKHSLNLNCRGAEWIVNSWLAKMQHINNNKLGKWIIVNSKEYIGLTYFCIKTDKIIFSELSRNVSMLNIKPV